MNEQKSAEEQPALLAVCWVDGLVRTRVHRFDEISPRRHFYQVDVADRYEASSLDTTGACAAERGNPGLTPHRREPRIAIKAYVTRTSIATQEANHCFDCGRGRGNPLGLGPIGRSRFPHRHNDQPRLHGAASLACFDQAKQNFHLCASIPDLFQRLSQLSGRWRLLRTSHQTTREVQDLPDRSTGAGKRNVCCLQLGVTGKRVEQSTRARHSLQVLWRRQAHLHNSPDDSSIPGEGGGMMCPRARTH